MILKIILMTLVGFLSGSVMYSYLLPKLLKGVDIRHADKDENPGSTNAIRSAGKKIGFLCMALDVLKAFVPVFVSVTVLKMEGAGLIPVAVAPVLGHAFSPMLHFRGGKAFSTFFGSLLGITPFSWIVLLGALCLFTFRFLLIIRPDSAGVVTSLTVASAAALFMGGDFEFIIIFIAVSLIVILKHLFKPDVRPLSISIGPFLIYERNKKIHP